MMKPVLGGLLAVVAVMSVACMSESDPTASDTSDLKAHKCGGFVANPQKCSKGYTCVANKIPDLPGTCKKDCVQKVACTTTSHFDKEQCKCVPNCIENVLCAMGEHFDTTSCGCVADCVDTVLCIQGDHWDATTCACVPN